MISLCMIVKNEAHCLDRCLSSVHKYVDEIVIVDTGSDDDTIKIAQQYGARVFSMAWGHDFAAARNFSIEQAQGEWILYLDADEKLVLPPNKSLKQLTTGNRAEAYYFTIDNIMDNGETLRHINVRLFRNNPHYRFEGKIHEQILDAIRQHNPQGLVVNSGLNILHYGYLSSQWAAKDKTARNYTILQKLLQQQPHNPFYLYHLGNTCMALNNPKEGAEHYQRALKYVDFKGNYTPSLLLAYVSCLIKTGRFKEAFHHIELCQQHYPDYPDIYFLAGELYKYIGLTNQSIRCHQKCLQIGDNPHSIYTTKAGIGSFLSFFQLAKLHQSLGQYDKAIHYQLLGIKTKGADDHQLVKLVSLLKNQGASQIPAIIGQLLTPGQPINQKTNLRLAKLLVEAREYAAAQDILEQLPFQDHNRNYLQGICHFYIGNHLESFNKLKELPADFPLFETALWFLIVSCWSLSPSLDASNFIKQLAGGNDPLALMLAINDMLVQGGDTPLPVNVDESALWYLVDKIIHLDSPLVALKVLTLAGLTEVPRQIAYLIRQPVKDKPLELAAKLALAQIKKGFYQADYHYLLAYYFYNNQELSLAQQMITKALDTYQLPHYQKLQQDLFHQQLVKIVTTALNTYPHNQQLKEHLFRCLSPTH